MPAYCEPWPVKRKAMRGGSRAREPRPRDKPAPRACGERLEAALRLRRAIGARPRRDRAGARGPSPACARRRRVACPAPSHRCVPAASSRQAPRASRRRERQEPGAGPGSRAAGVASAPRQTTWALVPLKPNELTPRDAAAVDLRATAWPVVGTVERQVVPRDVRARLRRSADAPGWSPCCSGQDQS